MSWRPNNWPNPYKHGDSVQAWDVPEAYDGVQDEEYNAYEAGADAMLEALKMNGIYGFEDASFPYDASVVIPLHYNEDPVFAKSGWLVFIPEEVTETLTSGSDESPKEVQNVD